MHLIPWTAVAGLLIATGACGEASGPSSTAKLGPIRLSVSSSAPELVRGSGVTFRVDLVNEGSGTVTLHFEDTCRLHPNIRNEAGEIVIPSGGVWGCPAFTAEIILPPGQPTGWYIQWRGIADFESAIFYTGSVQELPPGKYVFIAELPLGDATLRASTPITLK